MKSKTDHHKVSPKKIKAVKELSGLTGKRTILIASIKNIPASQFQDISKKLRGTAVIKVPKKNLIKMVLNSSKKEATKLEEQISDSTAIIFSDHDPFDLAAELMQNMSPMKAKPGQIAPEDIEIPAGLTDLPPGPAITELSALGIPVQIDKGKISIKQAKVVAKKGEAISKGAAEVMGKLDIKPFKVGFIPLAAYDGKDGKIYLEMKIDREGTLNELKETFSRSLALAVGIGYTAKETIGLLLGKAEAQAKRINRIVTGEPEEVAVAAESALAVHEIKQEEAKADAAEGLASLFG